MLRPEGWTEEDELEFQAEYTSWLDEASQTLEEDLTPND